MRSGLLKSLQSMYVNEFVCMYMYVICTHVQMYMYMHMYITF